MSYRLIDICGSNKRSISGSRARSRPLWWGSETRNVKWRNRFERGGQNELDNYNQNVEDNYRENEVDIYSQNVDIFIQNVDIFTQNEEDICIQNENEQNEVDIFIQNARA